MAACAIKESFGYLRVSLAKDARKGLRLLIISENFSFRARTVVLNWMKTVYEDTNAVVQPWVFE